MLLLFTVIKLPKTILVGCYKTIRVNFTIRRLDGIMFFFFLIALRKKNTVRGENNQVQQTL